ncbi:hypothetical protein LA080_006451 [Diaporthe eres]|nr:hypothetical protein LA080_006451 [Diaporthe eres]
MDLPWNLTLTADGDLIDTDELEVRQEPVPLVRNTPSAFYHRRHITQRDRQRNLQATFIWNPRVRDEWDPGCREDLISGVYAISIIVIASKQRIHPFVQRVFLTASVLAEMMHQGLWADRVATPKDDVYLGPWINWSRGPVMGATLTLNGREGKLLLAFTAVFIGVATGRLWRIACMSVMLSPY